MGIQRNKRIKHQNTNRMKTNRERYKRNYNDILFCNSVYSCKLSAWNIGGY